MAVSFRHNSVQDLEYQLQHLRENQRRQSSMNQTNPRDDVVVLIESVYSMDGDVAPIKAILDVCEKYGAVLVVDEAHGLGVFGRPQRSLSSSGGYLGTGVLAQAGVEDHPALMCSVHTFGKAAGCHGAVICGSTVLKSFLVNYGYPVIYSTALPLHSLITIQCAYDTMTGPKGEALRNELFRLVHEFRNLFQREIGCLVPVSSSSLGSTQRIGLLPSTSPIQALMIPGNQLCTDFCRIIYRQSRGRIRLYPIKTPTVPSGQERVRIIIHAHNTSAEVTSLVSLIRDTLLRMGLLKTRQDNSSLFLARSRL